MPRTQSSAANRKVYSVEKTVRVTEKTEKITTEREGMKSKTGRNGRRMAE